MAGPDPDSCRAQRLRRWLTATLGAQGRGLALAPLAGDASFRRYYRARRGAQSWVVMDAPPGKEDVAVFCDVAARLHAAGLNAPRVEAADLTEGFLLLSDLGDALYLGALDASTMGRLYGDAVEALLVMQSVPTAGMPPYDESRLGEELQLFPDWFLRVHLGETLSTRASHVLSDAFALLVERARMQPQRFVHRDYHSRNLLVHARNPGILDFQDAVVGPLSYDLVSLLKDVYIRWPAAVVDTWVDEYVHRARERGYLSRREGQAFRGWFDLMGVQRHLKIAGIFCRLNYRDGKPAYLQDLPLTLAYLSEALSELGPLRGLRRLFDDLRLEQRVGTR